MKMILFILNDPSKVQELLNAWQQAGATGATMLYSTGMGRMNKSAALREDLPLMPSLTDLFGGPDETSRTIFTLVKDDAAAQLILSATREIVGELSKPGSGLLAILPVDQVEGLDKECD